MNADSPQTIYENLNLLEQGDTTQCASYRQMAQDVLADPDVSLTWRQAIADRLNWFNQMLGKFSTGKDDSY